MDYTLELRDVVDNKIYTYKSNSSKLAQLHIFTHYVVVSMISYSILHLVHLNRRQESTCFIVFTLYPLMGNSIEANQCGK